MISMIELVAFLAWCIMYVHLQIKPSVPLSSQLSTLPSFEAYEKWLMSNNVVRHFLYAVTSISK